MARSQEQSRRSIGAALTASRGSGAGMAARRRGLTTVSDLNSLVTPPKQRKQLAVVEPRGAVPATQGRADYTPPPTTTGGIASPLTETEYAARQYYTERTITSSDGLLSIRVKPIKQITQTDANDAEVVQIFAVPPVPTP
jgi:hypothetical protein